jgi:hypothetical protein
MEQWQNNNPHNHKANKTAIEFRIHKDKPQNTASRWQNPTLKIVHISKRLPLTSSKRSHQITNFQRNVLKGNRPTSKVKPFHYECQ